MRKLTTLFFMIYAIGAMAQCEIKSFNNQYGFEITKQITNPGEYQNKIIKWAITDFTGLEDMEYDNNSLIVFKISDNIMIDASTKALTLYKPLISYLTFEIKDNELIITFIPKYVDLDIIKRSVYEYQQYCLFSDYIQNKNKIKPKQEKQIKKQGASVVLQINKIINQYEDMIEKQNYF